MRSQIVDDTDAVANESSELLTARGVNDFDQTCRAGETEQWLLGLHIVPFAAVEEVGDVFGEILMISQSEEDSDALVCVWARWCADEDFEGADHCEYWG